MEFSSVQIRQIASSQIRPICTAEYRSERSTHQIITSCAFATKRGQVCPRRCDRRLDGWGNCGCWLPSSFVVRWVGGLYRGSLWTDVDWSWRCLRDEDRGQDHWPVLSSPPATDRGTNDKYGWPSVSPVVDGRGRTWVGYQSVSRSVSVVFLGAGGPKPLTKNWAFMTPEGNYSFSSLIFNKSASPSRLEETDFTINFYWCKVIARPPDNRLGFRAERTNKLSYTNIYIYIHLHSSNILKK